MFFLFNLILASQHSYHNNFYKYLRNQYHMSLRDLQEEVNRWTQQFEPSYWPALEQMAELTEETGEVARVLNIMYGHKNTKTDEVMRHLEEELVDVIFPIICIANREGIDLQAAWDKKMREKLYGRDKNRFQKK
jgi:NTP pyrophosphatase (non-canonical NTP hydrolase)